MATSPTHDRCVGAADQRVGAEARCRVAAGSGRFADDDMADPSTDQGGDRTETDRPAAQDDGGLVRLDAAAASGDLPHRQGFGERGNDRV